MMARLSSALLLLVVGGLVLFTFLPEAILWLSYCHVKANAEKLLGADFAIGEVREQKGKLELFHLQGGAGTSCSIGHLTLKPHLSLWPFACSLSLEIEDALLPLPSTLSSFAAPSQSWLSWNLSLSHVAFLTEDGGSAALEGKVDSLGAVDLNLSLEHLPIAPTAALCADLAPHGHLFACHEGSLSGLVHLSQERECAPHLEGQLTLFDVLLEDTQRGWKTLLPEIYLTFGRREVEEPLSFQWEIGEGGSLFQTNTSSHVKGLYGKGLWHAGEFTTSLTGTLCKEEKSWQLTLSASHTPSHPLELLWSTEEGPEGKISLSSKGARQQLTIHTSGMGPEEIDLLSEWRAFGGWGLETGTLETDLSIELLGEKPLMETLSGRVLIDGSLLIPAAPPRTAFPLPLAGELYFREGKLDRFSLSSFSRSLTLTAKHEGSLLNAPLKLRAEGKLACLYPLFPFGKLRTLIRTLGEENALLSAQVEREEDQLLISGFWSTLSDQVESPHLNFSLLFSPSSLFSHPAVEGGGIQLKRGQIACQSLDGARHIRPLIGGPSDLSIEGVFDCIAEIRRTQVEIAYTAHDVVLESNRFRLSIPKIDHDANAHHILFSDGKEEGSASLKGATYLEKGTDLLFADLSGQVRLTQEGIWATEVSTLYRELRFEGEVALTHPDDLYTLHIGVQHAQGPLSSLAPLLNQISPASLWNWPIAGCATTDDLSLFFRFAEQTEIRVDLTSSLMNAEWPLREEISLSGLHAQVSYRYPAQEILLSGIEGEVHLQEELYNLRNSTLLMKNVERRSFTFDFALFQEEEKGHVVGEASATPDGLLLHLEPHKSYLGGSSIEEGTLLLSSDFHPLSLSFSTAHHLSEKGLDLQLLQTFFPLTHFLPLSTQSEGRSYLEWTPSSWQSHGKLADRSDSSSRLQWKVSGSPDSLAIQEMEWGRKSLILTAQQKEEEEWHFTSTLLDQEEEKMRLTGSCFLHEGDEGWKCLFDQGFFNSPFGPLHLEQAELSQKTQAKILSTQFLWKEDRYSAQVEVDLSERHAIECLLSVEGKEEEEPLLLLWAPDPLTSTPTLRQLEGTLHGISMQLVRDHTDRESTSYYGSLSCHLDALLPHLSQTTRDRIQQLEAAAQIHLQGIFTLPSEGEEGGFRGSLSAHDLRIKGIEFERCDADGDLSPTTVALHSVKIRDAGGVIESETVVAYKEQESWELSIPHIRALQLRPHRLYRKSQPLFGNRRTLIITELQMRGFFGKSNDPTTWKGEGTLAFHNPPKRDLSKTILALPDDLLGLLGLDFGSLIPATGSIHYRLERGNFYLTRADVYSHAYRSQFLLAQGEPSYIGLDGTLNLRVRMKQHNLILKITQLFTVAIDGTLAHPLFSLKQPYSRRRRFANAPMGGPR